MSDVALGDPVGEEALLQVVSLEASRATGEEPILLYLKLDGFFRAAIADMSRTTGIRLAVPWDAIPGKLMMR